MCHTNISITVVCFLFLVISFKNHLWHYFCCSHSHKPITSLVIVNAAPISPTLVYPSLLLGPISYKAYSLSKYCNNIQSQTAVMVILPLFSIAHSHIGPCNKGQRDRAPVTRANRTISGRRDASLSITTPFSAQTTRSRNHQSSFSELKVLFFLCTIY